MIKYVPARLLGGLLCAASAFALPGAVFAIDEPAQLSEDVTETEIMPPGSSDERADRREMSDDRSDEAPTPKSEPEPEPDRAPERAPDRSSAERTAPERFDREAAKRALLDESTTDKDKPNPLLDARGPDYYDRRAKELLKEDTDKSRVDLHPLMQAHPESYVIVCTAGCPGGDGAKIVSMLPKRKVTPPISDPATAAQPEVSCVGGCGSGGNATFASTPPPFAASTAVAATIGEWMTTVAKVPAGAETPAPKAAGSGDWMDKINRERDAAQAAKSEAASQVTAEKPNPAPQAQPSAKPAVMAETKSAAAATVVKPAAPEQPVPAPAMNQKPVAPIEAKPALTAEAKPAATPAPAAPAPKQMAALETPKAPAPVAAKPDSMPAAPVSSAQKPADANKPLSVEGKASAAPAPVAPEPQQMAALEMPKVPSPPAAKSESIPAALASSQQKPTEANKPLSVESSKTATAAPAPAVPAPQQMAALETPKAPSAPTATPETKPAASVTVIEPNPAAPAGTPKDTTKVAALEPPSAEKPDAAVPPAPKERVISVMSEDKDMNAAIQTARGSIATFWKSYDTPATGETDHALKVAVAGNGATEHFWLTRIKREDGKISGVISNQPQSVKTVKIGQRYEFTADMISDWTFKRNGKLVGNETMRVLLPRMPEEQAAVYRNMYETP